MLVLTGEFCVLLTVSMLTVDRSAPLTAVILGRFLLFHVFDLFFWGFFLLLSKFGMARWSLQCWLTVFPLISCLK